MHLEPWYETQTLVRKGWQGNLIRPVLNEGRGDLEAMKLVHLNELQRGKREAMLR